MRKWDDAWNEAFDAALKMNCRVEGNGTVRLQSDTLY